MTLRDEISVSGDYLDEYMQSIADDYYIKEFAIKKILCKSNYDTCGVTKCSKL